MVDDRHVRTYTTRVEFVARVDRAGAKERVHAAMHSAAWSSILSRGAVVGGATRRLRAVAPSAGFDDDAEEDVIGGGGRSGSEGGGLLGEGGGGGGGTLGGGAAAGATAARGSLPQVDANGKPLSAEALAALADLADGDDDDGSPVATSHIAPSGGAGAGAGGIIRGFGRCERASERGGQTDTVVVFGMRWC